MKKAFYVLIICFIAFSIFGVEIKYASSGSLFLKTELDLYNLKKMKKARDYKGINKLIKSKRALQFNDDLKVIVLQKDPRGEKAKVRLEKNNDIYWVLTSSLIEESEVLEKKDYVNLNAIMIDGTVFEEHKFSEVIDYLKKKTKGKKLRFAKGFLLKKDEEEPLVSLVLTDMPLKIFLNYLCKSLDMKYKVKNKKITFYREHKGL